MVAAITSVPHGSGAGPQEAVSPTMAAPSGGLGPAASPRAPAEAQPTAAPAAAQSQCAASPLVTTAKAGAEGQQQGGATRRTLSKPNQAVYRAKHRSEAAMPEDYPRLYRRGQKKQGSSQSADSDPPGLESPRSSSSTSSSRGVRSGPIAGTGSLSVFDRLGTSQGQSTHQQHRSGNELQSSHSAAGFDKMPGGGTSAGYGTRTGRLNGLGNASRSCSSVANRQRNGHVPQGGGYIRGLKEPYIS